jgi:two-component system sensor histidine kinase RegB
VLTGHYGADGATRLSERKRNWVRVRTLAQLRWYAVAGQIGAVLVATYIYHLSLEVGLIAMVIGLPTFHEHHLYLVYPESRRLWESGPT